MTISHISDLVGQSIHGVPKKHPLCFLVITSANEHRFSQLFHC